MIRRLLLYWDLLFGWRRLNIRSGDFILDMGSGDNPCVRADIVCDKYLRDNAERAGEMKLQVYPHQKLIMADAEKLPFKDKAFDYVVCRHLLEHINNPEIFFKDLMRVAMAGYIESPSELMERLYGWPFHVWFIKLENKKLILARKSSSNNHSSELPDALKKTPDFERLVRKNQDIFLIKYEWKDRIDYEIISCQPQGGMEDFKRAKLTPRPFGQKEAGPVWKRWLKYWILKTLRLLWFSPPRELLDFLACPECKGSLQKEKDRFVCYKCRRYYPIVDEVPFLIKEESNEL